MYIQFKLPYIFDITLDYATQCLTAEFPKEEEETGIFGLPEPCPCMKMETVLYDPHNSPVEALFACYRKDKYKFKFKAGHYIRHSIQSADELGIYTIFSASWN